MNNPTVRNENIVVKEFADEILIYDLKTNKAFCLNETSALIWQACDGKKSVAEISRILSKRLNQPMSEDVIWLALDNFKKDNLLEESEEIEIDFNGLNRRQIIKKIGFASMVALPVINALIAPRAVEAQSLASCSALFQPCIFNNNRQSNCCSSLRCVSNAPNNFCGSCRDSGTFLGSCTSVGGCGNCDTLRNLCCDSSVPTTNSAGFCRCG